MDVPIKAVQDLARALKESIGFLEAWKAHLGDTGRDGAVSTVQEVIDGAREALRVHAHRSIAAMDLEAGMWLAYNNGSPSERVVDVQPFMDERVRVSTDFGAGGEPATHFYAKDERVRIDLIRSEVRA